MATTTILFATDGVTPTPSVSSVHVVSGDGIHLAAASPAVTVYLSPGLIRVLTPAPEPSITLNGTAGLDFTFTSSDEGSYRMLVTAEPQSTAPHFPDTVSSYLHIAPLLHDSGGGFTITFADGRTSNVA